MALPWINFLLFKNIIYWLQGRSENDFKIINTCSTGTIFYYLFQLIH